MSTAAEIPIDHPAGLWADSRIGNLGVWEWPDYGTQAWLDLPPDSPMRYAAVLAAAERWRVEHSWMPQDVPPHQVPDLVRMRPYEEIQHARAECYQGSQRDGTARRAQVDTRD